MRYATIFGAAAFLFSTSGFAATSFTDTFDTEPNSATPPPLSTLNDTSFINWFAPPSQGTVDTVVSGEFGITCAGGSGKCVDLDGSTSNAGLLLSKALFTYNVGDIVNLSFQISGNQRGAADDQWFGGFYNENNAFYGNAPTINGSSFSGSSPCGAFSGGAFSTRLGTTGTGSNCLTPSASPWTTYNIGFQASNSGAFRLIFGDQSVGGDNQGALLDNISLSIAAVPEPATWAMMILGFGFIGASLRRRKAASVPLLA